jgi:histidine triad (HIT) family protein
MTDDCIFCKICKGEAPSFKVHEDADTFAFMDIMPQATGHALVISKEHAANLFEVSDQAAAAVTRTVKKVATAVRAALAPDGIMIAQFNGAAAGQTVWHYHVHIIPRTEGVPLQIHARERGDMDEIRALGEKISAAIR